jgi:molybdopterin synthase sulfur carrier subunit
MPADPASAGRSAATTGRPPTVTLLFFAGLRDRAGFATADLAPPAAVTDVAGLVAWLVAEGGGAARALSDLRMVRVAVNQEHVGFDHPVRAGDEVAFFPPVTGG